MVSVSMGEKIMNNKELLKSPEFEEALLEATKYKKNLITTYKEQQKANFQRFEEVMTRSNPKAIEILSKKRKNRTDSEKEFLKSLKRNIRQSYNSSCDFIIKQADSDGKKTKLEKMIDKIVDAIQILRTIDNPIIDNAFNRAGIKLDVDSNANACNMSDAQTNNMKDIISEAVNIKNKVKNDNAAINEQVFENKVPVEFRYDKKMNNTGLKSGDFRKLVDMKTKLLMATSKDAKSKVDEKIEKAAADKQFEVARAELVRDTLIKL